MSLSRLATRICLIQLLIDAGTIAEGRVFDSRIDPIDQLAPATRLPFIVVVSDTDILNVQGREITVGERSLELVVEMGIATNVQLADSGDTKVDIADTDGSYEILLDVLEYQLTQAIQASPGPWAELFRSFVNSFSPSKTSRRASDATKGVRWAARQVVFTVDTLGEPLSGEPLGDTSVWLRLGALLAAHPDPNLNSLANVLAHLWASPTRADWQIVQASLGLTVGGVTAMGNTPAFDDDPPTSAPPIIEIVVQPDDMVINADNAEEQDPTGG